MFLKNISESHSQNSGIYKNPLDRLIYNLIKRNLFSSGRSSTAQCRTAQKTFAFSHQGGKNRSLRHETFTLPEQKKIKISSLNSLLKTVARYDIVTEMWTFQHIRTYLSVQV